jgi:hypothetical protein
MNELELGGIADRVMLEVFANQLRLPLHAAQCFAVALTNGSFVRAGASLVTACLRSALAISSGLSSGL